MSEKDRPELAELADLFVAKDDGSDLGATFPWTICPMDEDSTLVVMIRDCDGFEICTSVDATVAEALVALMNSLWRSLPSLVEAQKERVRLLEEVRHYANRVVSPRPRPRSVKYSAVHNGDLSLLNQALGHVDAYDRAATNDAALARGVIEQFQIAAKNAAAVADPTPPPKQLEWVVKTCPQCGLSHECPA
jgi:hypothetical protein